MGDTFYRERVGVRSSEEVIDRKELSHLRMMARRGADYEAAAREFRNRHLDMLQKQRDAHLAGRHDKVQWCAGWLAAIREFSELVVKGETSDG